MFGRTYTVGLALTLAAFGRSLLAARLYSLIGWIAAFGLLITVARRWTSHPYTGVLGALLFAASTKAFIVAHFVRPEIWLTACILAVLLVLLHAANLSYLALVGGVGLIWLADFHLIGLFFGAALGTVFSLVWIVEKRGWQIGQMAAGVFLGAGLIIAVRLQPGGITEQQMQQVPLIGHYFIEETLREAGDASTPPQPIESPTRGGIDLSDEARSMLMFFRDVFWTAGGPLALIEMPLALVGVLYAILSRQRTPRIIAGVYSLALLLFALFSPLHWVQYGILWSPASYLLGTVGLAHFFSRHRNWLHAILIVFIGLNLVGNAWLAIRGSQYGYRQFAERIQAHLPSDARVVGDIVWWWALDDQVELVTDQHLLYAAQYMYPANRDFYGTSTSDSNQQIAQRVFTMLNPEYILLDDAIGCSGSSAVHTAFTDLVTQVCTPIAAIRPEQTEWSFSPLGQATAVYRCP